MSEIFANQRNKKLSTESSIGHAKSLRQKIKREKTPARHPADSHTREHLNIFTEENGATTQRRYSVVSMFSGCGGMDLGFHGDFTF